MLAIRQGSVTIRFLGWQCVGNARTNYKSKYRSSEAMNHWTVSTDVAMGVSAVEFDSFDNEDVLCSRHKSLEQPSPCWTIVVLAHHV